MHMQHILIVGATSAIAQAFAREMVSKGASLFLVGRNAQKLEAVLQDIQCRAAAPGQIVSAMAMDATDYSLHPAMIDAARRSMGHLDTALIAHGVLPDQSECQFDASAMLASFEINALSTMSIVTLLANEFDFQGHGTIGVIGSVAGDRGRQSNYVYGAAKGALSIFLQGVRHRLSRSCTSRVSVVTIKPGFVDTPMTAAFPKGPLWASPEKVGKAIVDAMQKGKAVAYVPGFWRWIMLVVRHIPEVIFRRLAL